jgi:hypothetical protein
MYVLPPPPRPDASGPRNGRTIFRRWLLTALAALLLVLVASEVGWRMIALSAVAAAALWLLASGRWRRVAVLRRRSVLLPASAVTLALGVACAYLGRPYPPGPGVRYANVERIELGMTRPEVEAIIGLPAQHQVGGDSGQFTPNAPADYHTALMWSDAECDIWVFLDRDGRVISREGVGGRPPSWLDRLQQRLGYKP